MNVNGLEVLSGGCVATLTSERGNYIPNKDQSKPTCPILMLPHRNNLGIHSEELHWVEVNLTSI